MKRLLNWFRRGDLERSLDRELRYHLEPDVSAQATLELGGLTQVREEVRDIWLTRWLRENVSGFCPACAYHASRTTRLIAADKRFQLASSLSYC